MFVKDTDTLDSSILGSGYPVSNMEQQVFYTLDSSLSNYDPFSDTSTWVRIKGCELKATEEAGEIAFYDQFDEEGVKRGRISTTFEITQDYRGLLQSIKKLENLQLWYAEGIQDDRDMLDANNDPIFHELNFYNAKLTKLVDDKGEIYKCTGSGKFNSATQFSVFKGITPTAVTISGATGLVSGSTASLTITGTDLYSDAITLTDIADVDLQGEITSISVEAQAGSLAITQSAGTNSNIVKVTCASTSAGSIIVKGKIVTSHGGTFYSTNKTITYTTV